jgi:alkanesulfonate monooxygenase SsuD/methylene tetrahydromethanopterin reductase-like flavin-dependent oxidoreductase (luciferase family)
LKTKLDGRDLDEMEKRGIVVGLPPQIINKLKQYEASGCEEIMLQWIDLDNLDGLVDFSEKVLPEFI